MRRIIFLSTIIPVKKLVQILFGQLTKPLAYRIALYAKQSPFFRNKFCLPLARIHRKSEKRYNTNKKIKSITEEEAVELGTSIIAEGIIFLVTAGLFLMEYNRSKMKARNAAQAEKEEIEELRLAAKQLLEKVNDQERRVEEVLTTLGITESQDSASETPKHQNKCFKRVIKQDSIAFSSECNDRIFEKYLYNVTP